MERDLIKSFDEMLGEQLGSSYTAQWAVEEFAKAVATGAGLNVGGAAVAGANNPPMGDASPLGLQNLDDTLTSVLFTEDHFELFGTLPRKASINLVYQFDKRLKYGGGRRSPGFVEGGSPKGGVSQWERDSATIRFFGVRRGITHQLMRIGEMGGSQLDPVAEENRNGTLQLLEEMERYIMYGDSAITDDAGRTVGYDGIRKQVLNSPYASTNYIDKLGLPLQFEDLEDIAQLLVETFFVTNFRDVKGLASPGIIADFSKMRYNIDRHLVTSGQVNETRAGLPFKGYESNFGSIDMKRHIFFQRVKGDAPIPSREGADPGSPATPAAITVSSVNDGTSATKLNPGEASYYTISSFNDSGESLAAYALGNTTPTTGQMNQVVITQVPNANGYRLYRGKKADGTDARWIADIPDAGAGGTTFLDRNQKRPGTGTFMLWLNEPETILVPQFMPLLKWPVAITTTTVEWFMLLYHTIVVKAPQRVVIFENVGRL